MPLKGPKTTWICLAVLGAMLLPARSSDGGSIPPGPRAGEPLLAIVVDDFGYYYNGIVEGFLSIDAPITLSVIPRTHHANRIAEEAHRSGKAVIAHIPMEPIEYPAEDPGEGALMVGQDVETLRELVAKGLDSSPLFEGVNNHMGSRAMLDRQVVEVLLTEALERNLYFVDSKTIAGGVAREVADSLELPFGENRLFWDTGFDTREEILANLDYLGKVALRCGGAIGIGHPRRVALEALIEKLPEFEELGIRLVFLRELVGVPQ